MSVFHYLKQFQRERNIIILEWEEKKEQQKIFLLIEQGKLLPLRPKEGGEYKLICQENRVKEKPFLTTFIYQDQIWGSVRFIGDAYWHENKKRFIAILWLYGNNKW